MFDALTVLTKTVNDLAQAVNKMDYNNYKVDTRLRGKFHHHLLNCRNTENTVILYILGLS